MKKLVSAFLSLCLVLSLCFVLTACGDKCVGTWKFNSMKAESAGMTIEVKVGQSYMGLTLTEDFMVIDIKKDGTFTMSMATMDESTTTTGTWEKADGGVALTVAGDTTIATFDGKLLVLGEDDSSMGAEITFKKK